MSDDSEGPLHFPDLLTVSEVAQMLRVSKMTVYRLIHTKQLAAIQVGNSFRVRRTAVADLLDD
jgi:excisionase family DNA binding protein